VEIVSIGAIELLVGRERELAVIDRFLDAAEAGALVLEGEAGIGKTSLWREGVRRASDRGFAVLVAEEVEAEAKLPFTAIADLLGPVAEEIAVLPLPQRKALRVALFLEEADAPLQVRAVAAALVGIFRELATARPLLVAVDDLQWLDRSSQEALLFALRRMETSPVLFLTSRRPGPPVRLPRVETVSVPALAVDATDRLLRTRLDLRLTRPRLARLHTASGGNPFYGLELGRALQDRGGAARDEVVPVPEDVSSLLRSRLLHLSPEAEEAILAAALLGRPTRRLVEVVASAEGLRAAGGAGILERRHGVIAFLHPLLAAAAVGEAEPEEVRTLHGRIAEAVSDGCERARHLALATTGEDEAVAGVVEQAAVAVRARGAVLEAANLSERALVLTPPDRGADRVRRGMLCARYLFEGGDAGRAAEVATTVLAAAAPGEERAHVFLRLGQARAEADDPVAALGDFAEGLAEPGLSEGTEASLLTFTGGYLTQLGRWAEAREYLSAAVPRARAAGEQGTVAQALALQAFADFSSGASEDLDAFEEAVALERGGAQVWWDWSPRLLYATCLVWTNAHARGLALFEEVVGEVRAAADPSLAAVLGAFAFSLIHRGDLVPAEATAREGFEEAVRDGRDAAAAVFPSLLTMIAAMRGDVEDARRAAEDAIARAERTDQARHVHTVRASIAELELSLGDPDAALATLAPSLRIWRDQGGAFPIFRTVPLAAQILAGLGRSAEARATAAEWMQAAGRDPTPDSLPLAHWTGAAIAEADGEIATADAAFVAAAEAARAAVMRFVLARILLARGSMLRRLRRAHDARIALKESLDLFGDIGAVVWATTARGELERLGGRRTASGKLTSTEQQIAELVARGKSNHEVASELYLSPKTVEWNLSKVYRKLLVRSRTELAAKLARRTA
jgi:DNA-binding CsgD family transcriptional regulator